MSRARKPSCSRSSAPHRAPFPEDKNRQTFPFVFSFLFDLSLKSPSRQRRGPRGPSVPLGETGFEASHHRPPFFLAFPIKKCLRSLSSALRPERRLSPPPCPRRGCL